MKAFKLSFIVTLIGILAALFWGGFSALLVISILAILEISLSFDNAVINVTVLKKMSALWQKRFLTWGIIIAVFGVRFLIPIIIVALIAQISLLEVFYLIFYKPAEYSKHLLEAHYSIAAFGGIFLLLVFLTFMLDPHKEIHWLLWFEVKIQKLGKTQLTIPIFVLFLLGLMIYLVPKDQRIAVLIAGSISIVLFILLHFLTRLFKMPSHLKKSSEHHSGFWNFIYLEILDASFSLDGVIGAFAITKDIIIILIGLMIGAVFVRSITVYLLQKGTLTQYRFLAHGAHYAIGALGIMMLASMITPVPEMIMGLIGILCIGFAFFSSRRFNRGQGGGRGRG